MSHDLIPYLPMIALLCWAAGEDVYARRIPNWLTVSMALAGIAWSIAVGHPRTPEDAMLGLLVGFALPLTLFLIDAVGAGDVKLLAALGAWLGPAMTFKVFVLEALIGMVIVIAQALAQRQTKALLRNSAMVAINLIHLQELGADHVSATGKQTALRRRLPYAVPVLAATLVMLLLSCARGGGG